jgi:nuclear transport factor 2 (NTF2) superfamily protein
MKFRCFSINDRPIKEAGRKFRWERKSQPTQSPGAPLFGVENAPHPFIIAP